MQTSPSCFKSKSFGRYAGAVMVSVGAVFALSVPAYELEEVVVTAQKREQNLQDVGVSVSAYDARTIRELGITTTEDLANLTPNLNVRNTVNGTSPVITIRGIGALTNDVVFATIPPSAAIHVDDVYFGSPVLLMFSQFDLERAEVLKGPQGTLYGRNTTAGAVNFLSARPEGEFGARLEGTYGQYETGGGYFESRGHMTGPLAEELNGRISFIQKFGDSYVTDLDDAPYQGPDMFAARVLLDWQASDSVSVLFNVHGGIDESAPLVGHKLLVRDAPGRTCNFEQFDYPTQDLVNCASNAPTATTPIVSDDGTRAIDFDQDRFQFNDDPHKNGNSGDLPLNDITNFGFSAQVDWELDNLNIVSITAYEDADVVRNELLAGRDYGTIRFYLEEFSDDVKQFSQELRIGSSGEKLKWLAGFYYYDEEIITNRRAYFRGQARLPEDWRTLYESTLDTESWALFGDLEYQLTDSINLRAGLRYTYEEKTFERFVRYNFQRNAAFDSPDPDFIAGRLNPITGLAPERFLRDDLCRGDFCTEDWDNVSGKLGLDYQVNDDVLLYGLVSTGFKGGQYSGSSLIFPEALSRPADPETLTSFEIGVKSQLLDNSLRLNAAIFDYDYRDLQIISTINTPQGNTSALDNADKADISGVDLDMLWLPMEGLEVSFALGYIDGEYTEFRSVDPTTEVVTDFSGSDLVNAPDLSYTVGVRYGWDYGSTRLSMGGEAVYTGDIDFDFRDSQPLQGDLNRQAFGREDLTVFNARFNIETEKGVNLMIWAKNLTDEEILNTIKSGLDEVHSEWGAPRSVGVTLGVNF